MRSVALPDEIALTGERHADLSVDQHYQAENKQRRQNVVASGKSDKRLKIHDKFLKTASSAETQKSEFQPAS